MLGWPDKYDLASQLSSAINCLHDEGIIYRGFNSNNILIHQGSIKLTDFRLSKRVESSSRAASVRYACSMIPYVDPKEFGGRATQKDEWKMKSDTYGLGVIFWEISSGRKPFAE